MSQTIDACGLSCPQPVLLFVNAAKQGGDSFTVLVDNDVSRENVTRAAQNRGFTVDVQEGGNGVFTLNMTKA